MKSRRGFFRSILGVLGFGLIAFKGRFANAKKLALKVEKVKALTKVGGAAKVKLAGQEILLIRDSEGSVRGLSPKCTHRQCDLKYNGKSASLDCDCHGSSFDLSGRVLKGPASKNLKVFPTKLSDGTIIIAVD